jgi:hypothetical protein
MYNHQCWSACDLGVNLYLEVMLTTSQVMATDTQCCPSGQICFFLLEGCKKTLLLYLLKHYWTILNV